MAHNHPRRRMYHARHAPVFVGPELDDNENLTDVQLQRRLLSFPTEMHLTRYREHWARRAVIEERRLSLENLPDRLKAVLRNRSWLDFVASTPDTSVTMNRNIVLEYYAALESRLLLGWDADMGLKVRGVDVQLNAEWINSYYRTPNVSAEEDFFVYDSRTVKPHRDNSLLVYEMAKLFGPSRLWEPKPIDRNRAHEYPSGWVRIILEILANRVFATIHEDNPTLNLYLLAYAFIRENVNVGKYIIVMIQNIARGIDGFGYAYFPFLITALARHFEVPEYDTDDISLATSPLSSMKTSTRGLLEHVCWW